MSSRFIGPLLHLKMENVSNYTSLVSLKASRGPVTPVFPSISFPPGHNPQTPKTCPVTLACRRLLEWNLFGGEQARVEFESRENQFPLLQVRGRALKENFDLVKGEHVCFLTLLYDCLLPDFHRVDGLPVRVVATFLPFSDTEPKAE